MSVACNGVPYFDVFDPRFDDFGVPTAVRGAINFKIADYREFNETEKMRGIEPYRAVHATFAGEGGLFA